MEFTKQWKNYRDNNYYIISFNVNMEEWQFLSEKAGTFIAWKNVPSQYGMTKSKAIEILNDIKELAEMPENIYNTQHKIVRLSSVTYTAEDVMMIEKDDYRKLQSTLIYIETTFQNNDIHVVVAEDVKSIENPEDPENPTIEETTIFYFYFSDAPTWFLELKTNIDYSLVSNVTTLDDIKELL